MRDFDIVTRAILSPAKLMDLLGRESEDSAAAIDAITEKFLIEGKALAQMINLAESSDAPLQIKAARLLKRCLTNKPDNASTLLPRLLELLSGSLPWEARLQLLQTLSALPIEAAQAQIFCDALQRLIGDRNKFIRAWAYSGLHHLAAQHAQYRADVQPLLQRAARKDSAAVKARLRRLPPLP